MTYEQAIEIIHSLGFASKMPCHTYSISARNCHRGGMLRQVEGSVCSKCYAMRGNFARPTIQEGLNKRQEAMQHPKWTEAMALVLTYKEHSGHFRWFSSGDLQSLADLIKICDVCRRTPHIKHWLPTHEVGILGAFKRAGFTYPTNLTVRLSGDMINKEPPKALLKNLGVVGGAVNTHTYSCPSSKQDNECRTCRKCWDKRVKMVTYKKH